MNVHTVKLDPIQIRRDHLYYALQAMIHTILVQRTIGISIKPKEICSPAFDDLTYILIDDPLIENKVETKIRELVKKMEHQTKGRIYLSLCSDTSKYGIMGNYMEHNEWERWYIEFVFSHTSDSLENSMKSILDHCHIPPQHIPTTNFSFDIIDSDASSLFDFITPFFS